MASEKEPMIREVKGFPIPFLQKIRDFVHVLRTKATHKEKELDTVLKSEALHKMGDDRKQNLESSEVARILEGFHQLWYNDGVWQRLLWSGIPILKNPFDLFQYQEILCEQRPDFVIECGSSLGGSVLYFAQMLDLLGHGSVISIDLEGRWHSSVLAHPRVTPLQGSSISPEVLNRVRALVSPSASCFVLLDSDHRAEHVLAELRAYQEFPQVGNYLIVEDGNINGRPVLPGWGPGPYEALQVFLKENPRFVVDLAREKKMKFSFAPLGWLKRVS